mmetsp:Transcript_24256/g.79089  ORF Transcript_24256/g.79089 Transcript_24256/m.79089 type:complete len:439 (-) Transcript_24256:59-1375(-)
MSTIGYGDVIPVTNNERIVSILGMGIGASTYAYIVGNVCSIVGALDAETAAFYARMDTLNRFMREKNIPDKLKFKLREYFRFQFNSGVFESRVRLMERMSPTLRAMVASYSDEKWIYSVPAFRNTPNEFMVEITLMLEHQASPPQEVIFRKGDRADRLFLVDKGIVAMSDVMYTKTHIFGDEFLMHSFAKGSQLELRQHKAITLTYAVLSSLRLSVLQDILERYPKVASIVNSNMVKQYMAKGLSRWARAVRRRLQKGESVPVPQVGKDNSFNWGNVILHAASKFAIQDRRYYDDLVSFMFDIERLNSSWGAEKLVWAIVLIQRNMRGFLARQRYEKVKQQQEKKQSRLQMYNSVGGAGGGGSGRGGGSANGSDRDSGNNNNNNGSRSDRTFNHSSVSRPHAGTGKAEGGAEIMDLLIVEFERINSRLDDLEARLPPK